MTDNFEMTPAHLRATAKDLADVSDRMKGVLSSLQGKLSGEGAAWGSDDIGHQFADGGDGYLAQLDRVSGSIDAKTQLLDAYSENLTTIANSFEQAEQA
jgi:uncharacterized protein YukE